MFLGTADAPEKSARTQARESFFLEFAKAIRGKFPDVPLIVTGGFRTRQGMEAAVAGGDCEMVGVGRPACLNPALPKNFLFNPEVKDQDAKLYAKRIEPPWLVKKLGFHAIGAGVESVSHWQRPHRGQQLTYSRRGIQNRLRTWGANELLEFRR